MKLPTLAIVVALLPAVGSAAPQFFDARNNAMGGVGVASSHYTVAGLANPALLTHFSDGDHFGFILPTFGSRVADEDDLIGAVDDFQAQIDAVQTAGTFTVPELAALGNSLLALDGKIATTAVGGGFTFAFASKNLPFALVAHTYLDAQGFVRVDPGDAAIIAGATVPTDLDSLLSEGIIIGAAISEIGLAFAHEFSLAGTSLSLGATPKAQRIDTINYSVNIDSFDEEDFDDSQFREDETNFNLDLGAALELSSLTFGLVARNVIGQDVQTVTTNGNTFVYELSPTLTAGVAWSNDTLTLAADIDVIGYERFKGLDDGSQILRLGGEFDAWTWAQLRFGYQTDLDDTVEDLFTAGIGIGIFDSFHLDIAAMASDSNTYGGVLQTTFTF